MMNTAELLTNLKQQGVEIRAEDNNKLSIRYPRGVLTPELQAELVARKAELLTLLQNQDHHDTCSTVSDQKPGLQTLGRLIGGFTGQSGYKPPIIDAQLMANQLTVTFKPLPEGYKNHTIIQFRQELKEELQKHGVKVKSWEEATIDFCYEINLPILNRRQVIKTRIIRQRIGAVIDVEKRLSLTHRLGIFFAETLYQLYSTSVLRNRPISVTRIAKLSSWTEDHVAKYIEDPNNTQVIVLTQLDEEFVNPELSYQQKIEIGLNALVKTFSQIVIGISPAKVSILNMNLSDSVYLKRDLSHFVAKSLIPKIYVPIAPLLMDRFELGEFNPVESKYAVRLVTLGQALASTGLFPAGFKLAEVLKRKSHRDIVNSIVNGRTGVSYGFLAYAEPPQYFGPQVISVAEWDNLAAIADFNSEEIRQNSLGRRYLKTEIKGEIQYQQIPDIWILSSRSGSNKTDLNLSRDVLRIGLNGRLQLQLPQGVHPEREDIKPSYDIYVMLAIALGAALYAPSLVLQGAPIVHFHGYPAAAWFQTNEYYSGAENLSVPCGTYESGIFNFLGIRHLAHQYGDSLKLASLIEPDHGTNVIAKDMDYLLERLKFGCDQGLIELGGRHFSSLYTKSVDSIKSNP